MEQPVISFKSFTFQYFSQAEPTLYDINLDIMPGEKILIVGPSGCGKSTLGHCLNGLIPFAYKGKISGSLTIKGKETKNESIFALSKNIGTVLQDSDGQFVGLNSWADHVRNFPVDRNKEFHWVVSWLMMSTSFCLMNR